MASPHGSSTEIQIHTLETTVAQKQTLVIILGGKFNSKTQSILRRLLLRAEQIRIGHTLIFLKLIRVQVE